MQSHQLWILLMVGFMVVANSAYAGLIDKIKDTYQDLEDKVSAAFEPDIKQEPSPESDSPVKVYSYPSQWQTRHLQEPVFNSEIFIVESGIEHNETVLLLHGLGEIGSQDWLQVIPALASQYHVVAFDLPGFGNSETPPGRYSPSNYAKIVAWLVTHHIKQNVYVIGHSMGGAVALRYAATYPEQVKKLILADVAGILEKTAFVKHSIKPPIDMHQAPKAVQKLGTQLIDLGGSLVEMSMLTPDLGKRLNNDPELWNRAFATRPNANAAVALIMENFSEAIKSLPHETYIIWGKQDAVAPLRTGILLNGRLQKAQLQVIEEAAHVPMKSHSEVFNSLVLSALSSGWPVSNMGKAREPKSYKKPQEDLLCHNEVGKTYSGNFRRIHIIGCTGIRLENVTAEKLRVEGSVIEVVDTTIKTEETAVKAKESVITATNTQFAGEVSMEAKGSRIDAAGVTFKGNGMAIISAERSRFIFSVSELQSDIYQGFVHEAFVVKNEVLDKLIAEAMMVKN